MNEKDVPIIYKWRRKNKVINESNRSIRTRIASLSSRSEPEESRLIVFVALFSVTAATSGALVRISSKGGGAVSISVPLPKSRPFPLPSKSSKSNRY